jgi:hypothetical protein
MSKRSKQVTTAVAVPAVPVVAAPATPAQVYVLGESAAKATRLRAGYVKAAWLATAAALPATSAQLAVLPEWQAAVVAVKGNKLSGYIAHWLRAGFIAKAQ